MPFLTAHPGSAPVLVTAVVLGVLRFTFPKDSRHRLELWKAILEHRRRRWQVAECRREVGRSGKTGQPDRHWSGATRRSPISPAARQHHLRENSTYPLDAEE
ncbi:hypothetical protein QWJ26_06650 [Streptomyces sp. CSDS2]|uniref:hypothetical protein n=1 Tax=Streptomyces sp. CSDS2 TaxID=3055051 RepID=UPI0025B05BFA|nr:hypothetical protein [Streptomyces sp. CSDS2]MDN3259498.1 hypothetical protein [Streptomyces sp. CSDS2]